jgi:tetratricopeptide (TPR) repeat protein
MSIKTTKKTGNSASNGTKAMTFVMGLTVFVGGIYCYRHSTVKNLIETYRSAWDSTHEKAAEIQQALIENEKLRYENANLRLKLETAQFLAQEKSAEKESEGNKVARNLASIGYQPPANLLPSQLYTLGVTYFKAQENEKAAVIFSFLAELDDNAAYRNSRGYVMTGVSWYRLGNMSLADHYFDLALKAPAEQTENLKYQAQARLWKGILAQRGGKAAEAQYWLHDLLDHHPQSTEAAWVNGPARESSIEGSTVGSTTESSGGRMHEQEAERATASVPESKE